MPSVKKSNRWAVRVDGSEQSLKTCLQDVISWKDTVKCLALAHDGKTNENPHCHFVIELSTELQKQSFDVRIKKVFGTEDRNYSSKVWDGDLDGGPSYLFHEETNRILVNKGFTDAEIKEAQLINESYKSKNISTNERKLKKVGKTHWDIIEEIRTCSTKFNGLNPHTGTDIVVMYDKESVWKNMCQILEKYKIRTQQNDLERWFTTVIRDDEYANRAIRDKIFSKLGL